MTPSRHQLREEFRIPDKARQRLVNTILTQGMDLLDQGVDSEVLEDVVINLHMARTFEKAIDLWCDQDLLWALDECPDDIKPTLWAWKQMVDSIRENPPF